MFPYKSVPSLTLGQRRFEIKAPPSLGEAACCSEKDKRRKQMGIMKGGKTYKQASRPRDG